jgi:hypothetical protein
MKNKIYLVIFYILIWLLAGKAYADMGGVHTADAQVSEDAQKAVILHNGVEEVLILGTDLNADKDVGLIRFIPFPSEPVVSLAPEKAFDAASELVKKHGLKVQYFTKGGSSIQEPVSLRFHQKLGAHDITGIKVNDATQFRNWVNDFFKKKNLPQQENYPDVEAVVEDYVKRGIVYFVFDFVELNPVVRSIEPLMYRFKSKEFYYPLKTSNTFTGQRWINLIAICPRTMGNAFGSVFTNPFEVEISSSSKIASQELTGIYPDSQDFFKAQKNLYIQLINHRGKYNFDQDMIADIAKGVDEEVNFSDNTSNPLFNDMGSLLQDIDQRFPEKGAK